MLTDKEITCDDVQYCIASTGDEALAYYGLDGWNLGSSVGIGVLYISCWALSFFILGYIGLRFKRFT